MSLCLFGLTKNGTCRKDYSNKPCNGTRNAPNYICNPKNKTVKNPIGSSQLRHSLRINPPTYGKNYLKTEFPKKMAIIITVHGQLHDPMKAPMKATRFISNDFGTCNFNTQSDRNIIHNFAINGDLSEVKRLIYIRDQSIKFRPEDLDDYIKYKEGIHYKKNKKTFIKGSKMLDKDFSFQMTNKEENDRSIIIRDAINPLSPYRDLVNRKTKKKQWWTLVDLMEMFHKGGCEELTIYDFSCSPYDGDVKNYKYGGS